MLVGVLMAVLAATLFEQRRRRTHPSDDRFARGSCRPPAPYVALARIDQNSITLVAIL